MSDSWLLLVIYFWLCWVFVAVQVSVAVNGGYSSCSVGASPAVASLVAARGLYRALVSVVAGHGL